MPVCVLGIVKTGLSSDNPDFYDYANFLPKSDLEGFSYLFKNLMPMPMVTAFGNAG